jgi:hypothetical protein
MARASKFVQVSAPALVRLPVPAMTVVLQMY